MNKPTKANLTDWLTMACYNLVCDSEFIWPEDLLAWWTERKDFLASKSKSV